MILIIDANGEKHYPQRVKYPSGELGVSLPEEMVAPLELHFCFKNSDDIVELMLVAEVLTRARYNKYTKLVIPYLPFARQDRTTHETEAFSLKAFARLVNSFNFHHVVLFDPHSDVSAALFDHPLVINQRSLFDGVTTLYPEVAASFDTVDVVIAPDAGAVKKANEVATSLGKGILFASKTRDTNTGKLSNIVAPDNVFGKKVLIVDDLIDAGGTFIGLAQELRKKGATNVFLYATHGLFTKGVDILLDSGIDRIVTFNTYNTGETGFTNQYRCFYADYRELLKHIK
jgi:ribose-phosphate pyrophosphokinase